MEPIITSEIIEKLSLEERLLLAEELWDSIAAEQEPLELPEDQKRELDRRLKSLRNFPEAGTDWETVKKSLLGE
ncbi:MAG: addiction module protein [Thermodesulfobacteriota bacterium]